MAALPPPASTNTGLTISIRNADQARRSLEQLSLLKGKDYSKYRIHQTNDTIWIQQEAADSSMLTVSYWWRGSGTTALSTVPLYIKAALESIYHDLQDTLRDKSQDHYFVRVQIVNKDLELLRGAQEGLTAFKLRITDRSPDAPHVQEAMDALTKSIGEEFTRAKMNSLTLTGDEACKILEQLALLTTDQHKTSKIVYYPKEIWLELANSYLRTGGAWLDWVQRKPSFRELECLPVLMYAVAERMKAEIMPMLGASAWQTITKKSQHFTLVRGGLPGLEALKTNQYNEDAAKKKLVQQAIDVLTAAQTQCLDAEQRANASAPSAGSGSDKIGQMLLNLRAQSDEYRSLLTEARDFVRGKEGEELAARIDTALQKDRNPKSPIKDPAAK
jgi:hypothetical protein